MSDISQENSPANKTDMTVPEMRKWLREWVGKAVAKEWRWEDSAAGPTLVRTFDVDGKPAVLKSRAKMIAIILDRFVAGCAA